ncbi:MAG: hypothetical protein M3Y52_08330, partial [Actinomycetota bacterium]|nr:hypothetical protein [Actinomycetota bacterium]
TDPTDPTDPTEPTEPGTPGDNGSTVASGGVTTVASPSTLASTGADTAGLGLAALLLLAGVMLVGIRRLTQRHASRR